MEKISKGSLLYDTFSAFYKENFEEELISENEWLGVMKIRFDEANSKLTKEYNENYIKKGIQTIENESEHFGSLYYELNQFIAWLNLVL